MSNRQQDTQPATLLQFMPRNQPVFNEEFRISSLQAANRNIVGVDSFYWPRTETEQQEWAWRHTPPTH